MVKVRVIKFQGVIESEKIEERVGVMQYVPKFINMKDCFYLKYLRNSPGVPGELLVSDNFLGWAGSEFTFDKIVRVVGYSTDVPLILNVNGKDQGVLMPNYVGTPEILPINSSDTRFAYSTVGYIVGIAAGTVIKVKDGTAIERWL